MTILSREALREKLTAYEPDEYALKCAFVERLEGGVIPVSHYTEDSNQSYTVNSMEIYHARVAVRKHWRYYPNRFFHAHSYMEILYMYDGSGVNNVEGVPTRMKQGDFCILSPDVYHFFDQDGDSVLMNILVRIDFLEQLACEIFTGDERFPTYLRDIINEGRHPKSIFLHGSDEICELADRLIIARMEDGVYADAEAEAWLTLLFARFTDSCDLLFSDGIHWQTSTIAAILNYLHARYDDVDLTSVAKQFTYTKSTICRLMKLHTGKTFSEYLNSIRMKRACDLLRASTLPVEKIAEQVGFRSIEYFNRCFKREFGMSPTNWRKRS